MASLKKAAADPVAYLLLAVMLINLPGAVTVLTESPGPSADGHKGSLLVYPFALAASLYLLGRYVRRSSLSGSYLAFLAFFTTYLGVAVVFSFINEDLNESDFIVLNMYAFQLLFISAIYFWLAQLGRDELEACLRFSKKLLLLGCLCILFSPFFPYYQAQAADRAGGFFIDQNQAAFAALYCLVLVAVYPAQRPVIAFAEAGIATSAVILTFSRTGLLVFIVLCGFYLLSRRSLWQVVLSLVGFAAVFLLLWATLAYDVGHLDFEQRQRLLDVGAILSGEASQKTYDQRDILFDIGLHRIAEQLPWGAGIGKFHEMEYGVRHQPTGHWLGVHNTYLLILGEAGLVGFLAFLAFWAVAFWKMAQSSQYRGVEIGLTVVLLSSMITTHAVFNYKVSAIMLAVVIALTARQTRDQEYCACHISPSPSTA